MGKSSEQIAVELTKQEAAKQQALKSSFEAVLDTLITMKGDLGTEGIAFVIQGLTQKLLPMLGAEIQIMGDDTFGPYFQEVFGNFGGKFLCAPKK